MLLHPPIAADPHQGVERRIGRRIPALVSAVSYPEKGRRLTPDLVLDSMEPQGIPRATWARRRRNKPHIFTEQEIEALMAETEFDILSDGR